MAHVIHSINITVSGSCHHADGVADEEHHCYALDAWHQPVLCCWDETRLTCLRPSGRTQWAGSTFLHTWSVSLLNWTRNPSMFCPVAALEQSGRTPTCSMGRT